MKLKISILMFGNSNLDYKLKTTCIHFYKQIMFQNYNMSIIQFNKNANLENQIIAFGSQFNFYFK